MSEIVAGGGKVLFLILEEPLWGYFLFTSFFLSSDNNSQTKCFMALFTFNPN